MTDEKIVQLNAKQPEPSEDELTAKVMAEYSEAILTRVQAIHGPALLAQLQLQALQLEEFMRFVFENDPTLSVSEFNRRLRVRTRAAIDELKNMKPAILRPEVIIPPP
jgi:hypothetical protein